MSIVFSKKLKERTSLNNVIVHDKDINMDYDGDKLTIEGNINDNKINTTIDNKDFIRDLLTYSKNNKSYEQMILETFSKKSKNSKNSKNSKKSKNRKNSKNSKKSKKGKKAKLKKN